MLAWCPDWLIVGSLCIYRIKSADGTVSDPVLVQLEMENGQVISPAPDDLKALQRAPEWSKSVLEAALRAGPASGA
jgi:hypothetical protein